MTKLYDRVKKGLRKKHKTKEIKLAELTPDQFLSSGSTLVNLAATGRVYGCYVKGYYFIFRGDSNSGKTWDMLTALAEACQNSSFDNYDLIYNGTTERGAMMNIKKYFGMRLHERLKFIYSDTIEEVYDDLDDRLDADKPFIYILDSMDGLNSQTDFEKYREQKQARRKGKQISGSYGDGKAKVNSQTLRKMLTRLYNTGSILIVIAQTRDAFGGFGGDTKTSGGGRSLKFYAALEMWTSVRKHLKKNYKGKDREQGILSLVKIKKNRIVGQDHTVAVPIYHSHGVDDVGSCIDYLLEEKHWRKSGNGSIKATEFKFKGKREALIKQIEKEDLERELRAVVRKVWREIQDAVAVKRKARYE